MTSKTNYKMRAYNRTPPLTIDITSYYLPRSTLSFGKKIEVIQAKQEREL